MSLPRPPGIFILLAVAIGTLLERMRIREFARERCARKAVAAASFSVLYSRRAAIRCSVNAIALHLGVM
jgi:hypothetical protein